MIQLISQFGLAVVVLQPSGVLNWPAADSGILAVDRDLFINGA